MILPVQNKTEILLLLKANESKIRSYGVESISLFGSFVKGTVTSSSDVDLLVSFDPQKKNFDNYVDLIIFLEELLGRKVEMVTPQSLSKYIGPYILHEAEPVFQ